MAEVAKPLAQQAALARVFGRVAAPPQEGPRALDVLQMLDHERIVSRAARRSAQLSRHVVKPTAFSWWTMRAPAA